MKSALLASITLIALSSVSYAANTTASTNTAESDARAAASFKKTDTNGDGFLSKEEFLAKPTAKFNEIDTNHDGKISPQEMSAYRASKKAASQKRKAALLAAQPSAAKAPSATAPTAK